MRTRPLHWLPAVGAAALLLLTATACGDDDDATTATTTEDAGGSSEPIVLGYSAWPGWFPLAVAEEAGIFEDVGLDVELKFFADYLGSLDAMAAGQLDGNTQTLNDTMFGVAAGDEQVIVVTNDNSSGNDAIICDESITSIEGMAGKTIAAEEGVVDHFLLLQGLASKGMTQEDIDFKGALTDAAAAGFAGGQFDCVGVFAPFTLTALERPGSHVVFSSADFPGTISDHIVVTPELIDERPEDVRKLVDAWYATLDYIEDNPDEALAIMAEAAQLSEAEYQTFAEGTTIFSADEALAAFADGDDTTSLLYTARLINPFLVSSGLSETEAPLDGLFDPRFTQDYVDRQGGVTVTDASAQDGAADLFGATPIAQGVVPGMSPARVRGRRQGPILRLRGDIPRSLSLGLGIAGVVVLFGGWLALSSVLDPYQVPSPAATWDAGVDLWRSGQLWSDFTASAERIAIGYSISMAIGVVLGVLIASFRSAESFLEAQIGFLRYIPATALLPLFLIWLGIDEAPKITLIVVGTVFFNTLMVADVARAVPQELVDASYTLGAGRWTVLRRVILPHSYPGMIDVARVNLAAGWLMLVVAELLAADDGLAKRLALAQRVRATDRMFVLLILFGLIGLVSDLTLRSLRRRTAPWSEGSR